MIRIIRVLVAGAVVALFARCAGDALSLRTPDFADPGTTIALAARSAEGGVRIEVTDRAGNVLLDSTEAVPDQSGDPAIRLTWRVPTNVLGPFRIQATDRTGARQVRFIRPR